MNAVANEIATPYLTELAQEARQSIRANVLIMLTGTVFSNEVISDIADIADSENCANGEIKILLKESSLPQAYNFFAECIIKGLATGTAFSGFVMRGKLMVGDDGITTKVIARTNRYNVWNWGKDFSFGSK
jgi:hypothetical protein